MADDSSFRAGLLSLRAATMPSVLVALAVTVSTLAGCAVVQPWQRGRLAQRHMQIPPTQGEAYLDQHVATSKESAAGGAQLEGGGCGCN